MPELPSLQDQVIQLEELVTHQEHLIQQLNEVLLQVRSDCDRMKISFQEKIDRLESLVEQQMSDYDPDEKPPHY
tara:strand:+ start:92 stop:313 length:222 start_codon:yes stop_codon:yes gene_type:complete